MTGPVRSERAAASLQGLPGVDVRVVSPDDADDLARAINQTLAHPLADFPPWHRFPPPIHARIGAPGATPHTPTTDAAPRDGQPGHTAGATARATRGRGRCGVAEAAGEGRVKTID